MSIEKDPTSPMNKVVRRRPDLARYLFAMIDGNTRQMDISAALVSSGIRPNLNVANNGISLLVKGINEKAEELYGHPIVIKETLQSPYTANPETFDQFVELRSELLPMDLGPVAPGLYMSEANAQRVLDLKNGIRDFELRADELLVMDEYSEPEGAQAMIEDVKHTFPNEKMRSVIANCIDYAKQGTSRYMERSKIGLDTTQIEALNARVQLMTGDTLFTTILVEKPKRRNEYVLNEATLARLLSLSSECANLPSIDTSHESFESYREGLGRINAFISGKDRSVGYLYDLDIGTSLILREMLKRFEHQNEQVMLRAKQVIRILSMHLRAWGVVGKEEKNVEGSVHSISQSRAYFEGIEKGNCKGVFPEFFYTERGESTKDAKSVCEGCAVEAECLEYALQNNEKFGIWGGKSERERRRLRRIRIAERKANRIPLTVVNDTSDLDDDDQEDDELEELETA